MYAVCGTQPSVSVSAQPVGLDGFATLLVNVTNVDRFRVHYDGSAYGYVYDGVQGSGQIPITVNMRCTTAARAVRVDAWNCQGGSDERHAEATTSIAPPNGQPQITAVRPIESNLVEIDYEFPYDGAQKDLWIKRLASRNTTAATLYQASPVLTSPRPLQYRTGTVGPKGVGEGAFIIILESCTGERSVRVFETVHGSRSCDAGRRLRCHDCVGDPVHTGHGNMRYQEVDPLPSGGTFVLKRTHDSRSTLPGFFGHKWTSALDAFLAQTVDSDGTVYITVSTQDDSRYVFRGTASGYEQIAPQFAGEPAIVAAESGGWRFREARSPQEIRFSSAGRPIGYREILTGRETQITWVNDLPSQIVDSWGAWSWTLTVNGTTRNVTQIAVDGRPDLTWSYAYNSQKPTTVTSPAGVWRTYAYWSGSSPNTRPLATVRDALGNIIEQHNYDISNRATTSFGPSGEIESIVANLPGRAAGERMTEVRWKNGRTEKHYRRLLANFEEVTVETEGGCSGCGPEIRSTHTMHEATWSAGRAPRAT